MSIFHDSIYLYYLPVLSQGYDVDLESAASLLDPQETLRLNRFRVKHARESFLQARRMLKTLLGRWTQQLPEAIELDYSENGKPWLASHPHIHFSLSHCRAAVAVAFADGTVGVDAEEISRGEKHWQHAGEFINDFAEAAVKLQESETHAANMFTHYWTAMESLVKLNDSSIYQERKELNLGSHIPLSDLTEYRVKDAYLWSLKLEESFRMCLASKQAKSIKIFRWYGPENTLEL